MLLQRPPPALTQGLGRSSLPDAPVVPARWARLRTVLLAITCHVLLRPTRIGTLLLFAGLIAFVLVDAEGWWFLLGVALFHAAAAAFIVLWVQIPATSPAIRWTIERTDEPAGRVPCLIPRPRRPPVDR